MKSKCNKNQIDTTTVHEQVKNQISHEPLPQADQELMLMFLITWLDETDQDIVEVEIISQECSLTD